MKILAAFTAGVLVALAVVALNAHDLYAWYWQAVVYRP